MVVSDRTADFRAVLLANSNATVPSRLQKTVSYDGNGDRNVLKQYLGEAYAILEHIAALSTMLRDTRQAYLSEEKRTFSSRSDNSRTGTKRLTNEERDQIDTQARVILSRCADRVKALEAIEKRRRDVSAKDGPMSLLLPFRPKSSSNRSECIAAHHSSIAWYLNRRLTEASQTQREMQEQRVKRHMERNYTLGSTVTRDAAFLSAKSPAWTGLPKASTSVQGILDDATNKTVPGDLENRGPKLELSQAQMLQYEAENESILRSAQNDLESVRQAEARLMDISVLQMELVARLAQQTELTDQLYDDSVTTVSAVEKSTVELREARRRLKDSRLFILVFFMGASLSLLFLHWY